MDIKKIKMNTFIANLSGISEHFNEQEIKCETESSMTSTIQLVDDDNKNMDMIIRFYRKDKKYFHIQNTKITNDTELLILLMKEVDYKNTLYLKMENWNHQKLFPEGD